MHIVHREEVGTANTTTRDVVENRNETQAPANGNTDDDTLQVDEPASDVNLQDVNLQLLCKHKVDPQVLNDGILGLGGLCSKLE